MDALRREDFSRAQICLQGLRVIRFLLSIVSIATLLTACGPSSREPQRPASKVASVDRHKPRCTGANHPADAEHTMTGLQGEVRRCFTLSAGGADSDVRVEVTVARSGLVRDAQILGTVDQPAAVSCLKKTLKNARFARFCGDDVSISWTYALR
jgi:hypothetical protein